MRSFSVALLDMDGTLVDSNELHVDAWYLAFSSFGRKITKEIIRIQIGKGVDMLIPALAPDISAPDQQHIGACHSEIFRSDFLKFVRPFPGAHALIELLHRRAIKVVLASSSGKPEIDHYVELLGIRDNIYAVTTKDEVSHSKPAPDIFREALKKIKPLECGDVIAIGDTPYDAIAATQCGIYTIGVRTGGFSDRELIIGGTNVIYDRISDIYDELNSCNSSIQ